MSSFKFYQMIIIYFLRLKTSVLRSGWRSEQRRSGSKSRPSPHLPGLQVQVDRFVILKRLLMMFFIAIWEKRKFDIGDLKESNYYEDLLNSSQSRNVTKKFNWRHP